MYKVDSDEKNLLARYKVPTFIAVGVDSMQLSDFTSVENVRSRRWSETLSLRRE